MKIITIFFCMIFFNANAQESLRERNAAIIKKQEFELKKFQDELESSKRNIQISESLGTLIKCGGSEFLFHANNVREKTVLRGNYKRVNNIIIWNDSWTGWKHELHIKDLMLFYDMSKNAGGIGSASCKILKRGSEILWQ